MNNRHNLMTLTIGTCFGVLNSGCEIEYKLQNQPGYSPFHNMENPFVEECEPLAAPLESDLKPVAVCDASALALTPIQESADFLGQDSYDPNGYEILDYQWRLIKSPLGSAAAMGSGIANRYDFTPDLIGEYTAQLVVTNDRCVQSDPCQVTIEAKPTAQFWVEMFWDKPGDDMDLHLLRNNADYESDGDCHYGNCVSDEWYEGLEWGESDNEDDNPHLDLDDIDDVGPENINIETPANGLYTIAVHDYPDSTYRGANNVTVRIYIDGEVKFEETRAISGEDTYVEFAAVEWPTRMIQRLE